jgi:hypothetical protein
MMFPPGFEALVLDFILGVTLGFVVGSITLHAPTWLFLRDQEKLWEEEFAKVHPDKQWALGIYVILRILGLFISFFLITKGTVYLVELSELAFFYLIACGTVTGVGILTGLFEILTGVSPVSRGGKYAWGRSVYVRAPWLHQYIYGKEVVGKVRKTGMVRSLLGLSVMVWSYLAVLFIPSCHQAQ